MKENLFKCSRCDLPETYETINYDEKDILCIVLSFQRSNFLHKFFDTGFCPIRIIISGLMLSLLI